MGVENHPQFIFNLWWCALFEAFVWSLLGIGIFAVMNRIWLWLFLKAETSRMEGRDDFAEASATLCTDPRAARSI